MTSSLNWCGRRYAARLRSPATVAEITAAQSGRRSPLAPSQIATRITIIAAPNPESQEVALTQPTARPFQ